MLFFIIYLRHCAKRRSLNLCYYYCYYFCVLIPTQHETSVLDVRSWSFGESVCFLAAPLIKWKQHVNENNPSLQEAFLMLDNKCSLAPWGPFSPASEDVQINGFTLGLISLRSILRHSRLAPAESLLLYWWIMSHAWGLFGSGLSGQRTIGLKWSVWKNMWHVFS